MTEPVFRLENLHKSYKREGRDDLEVLKGIDLEVGENSFLTIVGKSGSGKSTILQLMAAFDNPTSGEIWYRNQKLSVLSDLELSAYRNRSIGFIFQFHHLLPEFTSLENILLPGLIRQEEKRPVLERRAADLLNLVGLSDRADHKPSQLSGGEQQRVAIARALMNQPGVLFADEPTGNLDSGNSELIFGLLAKIHSEYETTLVVVTHNLELARMGKTMLEIRDGMFAEGSC